MADDEDRETNVGKDKRNQNRGDNLDTDRRSKDSDRHRRRRDNDRSRDDDSRQNRRRSRSRSGSRERTFSESRSGRDRGGGGGNSRRRSNDGDDDGGGAFGSSRSRRSPDFEDGRAQGKRNRRDDDGQSNERISGHDWRSKLTSIRDAHFNRSKQAPTLVHNQFKNDGSFMEMFKKKMAEQTARGDNKSSLTPNSLVLASSSIPFSSDLSLPPLTTEPLDGAKPSSSGGIDLEQDLDGVPMATHKSLPVPVSVGKRRLAKPLKTGIVIKKPQDLEEDEASEEKLVAWSRYLQELQKYKSSNCIDEDSSRPLVK